MQNMNVVSLKLHNVNYIYITLHNFKLTYKLHVKVTTLLHKIPNELIIIIETQ